MTSEYGSRTRKEWRRRQFRLRPMGVGEILDEALTLYRDNAKLFISVIWMPAVIIALGSTVGPLSIEALFSEAPYALPLAIAAVVLVPLSFFAWAYQQAAITYAIAERYLDRPTTAADVRRGIGSSIWRLVGSYMLIALLLGGTCMVFSIAFGVAAAVSEASPYASAVAGVLGMCGASVVALFVAVLIAFVVPVIVVEKEGVLAAITRSIKLSASRFLRTLGILLLLGLVSAVLSLLVQAAVAATFLPFGGGEVFVEEPILQLSGITALQEGLKLLLSSALSLLVVPFTSAAIVLTYFDIRIRNEAFDVELLARSLQREPAADFLL